MRTATRLSALSLVILLSLVALPAMAVEDDAEEEAPATTEVVDDEGATTEGDEEDGVATTEEAEFEYFPATVIDPPPNDAVEQPWTTKFLVPTGLALAAVAVFVTVVQYFVRVVRSRYKVVE